MPLKVLICGSDIDEIETLSSGLEGLGMESDYVNTGKDAQVKIRESRYFALLVDFKFEDNRSFDIVRYSNLNSPFTRVFILLTELKELDKFLLTPEDVLASGVTGILQRPVNVEQVFSKFMGEKSSQVEVDMSPDETESNVKVGEDDYAKVGIEDFYIGKTAIFDIYIRLSEKHYTKICQKGDSFGVGQIERFKKKNVRYLYFKKQDRLLYIRRMTDILNNIKGDTKEVHQEKTEIVSRLSAQFINETYTDDLSAGILKEATDLCEHTMELVRNDEGFSLLAKQIEEYSSDLYGHSTAVMFLATMICLQDEYASKQSADLISVGALFHDVGKTKLPSDLVNKNPFSMSSEELELYRTHPALGVEIVSSVSSASSAVSQIIGQHHELTNGQGFPNKLSGVKIYPLAKTVTLADYVVHFMDAQKCSLKKAISFFEGSEEYIQKFDKDAMKGLLNINKKQKKKAS